MKLEAFLKFFSLDGTTYYVKEGYIAFINGNQVHHFFKSNEKENLWDIWTKGGGLYSFEPIANLLSITLYKTELITPTPELKIGDKVIRMLAGTIPMELKITDISETRILCGPWEFDKITGKEIDEDIDTLVSHIIL